MTDIDTTGFTDKDSREARFLDLYERHDYLEAYARHTDLRVSDDPKWAIGRGDEWETHGLSQLRFLIDQGMKRSSRVLDLGCGTGRLARKLAPWLDPGLYTGVDISPAALDHARLISDKEGWADRQPAFVLSPGDSLGVAGPFDIVWAHSVFTHLPPEIIRRLLVEIRDAMTPSGRFLFTYKPARELVRTGLKQFKYPFEFFDEAARAAGLRARPIKIRWPASQFTGVIRWGATASIS